MTIEKVQKSCPAFQSNAKAPDFGCGLKESAHNIHVDPRTGTRWGNGKYPKGWNRKWGKKKYGNAKLSRHSSVSEWAKRARAK